jgi:hypothetical protein
MHMLLVRFYNIFVGAHVINQAEAHGHGVVCPFVLYFNAENLATVITKGTSNM